MQFSYCNVTVSHLSPFSQKNTCGIYFENVLRILMNEKETIKLAYWSVALITAFSKLQRVIHYIAAE